MGSLTSGGSTIAGADAHVDVRFTAASCVCLAAVLGVLGLADVHVANGGVDCSTVLGLADAHVANGDVAPLNGCCTVPVDGDGVHEVTSGGGSTVALELDFRVGFFTAFAVVDAHADNDDTAPLNGCRTDSVDGVHVATSGGDTTTALELDVRVGYSTAFVVVGVHVDNDDTVPLNGCCTVSVDGVHVATSGGDTTTALELDVRIGFFTAFAVVDVHVDNDGTVPLNGSVSASSVNGVHVATSGGDTTTALELDVRVGFFTAFAVVGVHVAKGNSVASFGC